MVFTRLAAFIFHIYLINASLLFRSNKKLEIPALKTFTNADMETLLLELEDPKVLTFTGISPKEFYNSEKNYNLSYSAYVVKEEVDLNTFFGGNEPINNNSFTVIEETQLLNDLTPRNILIIFKQQDKHINKREALTEPPTLPPPTGPVLFKGTAKSNFTAMMYSSRPLLLKVNSTERNLTDSNTHITFSVVKSISVKLSVRFTGENIFNLNFIYLNTTGDWSLESVEHVLPDNTKTTLTTKRQIYATKGFSYHCSGPTEFTDANKTVGLVVYDLQTEIGHALKRFDDAYDCVPFVTAPIWSGLMVSFMLGIGLAIALSALGNIKTMVRYDSQKKGQLSITVFE